MKKLYTVSRYLVILLFIFFSVHFVSGQELLQSIDTKEAMSKSPDSEDDLPADLKVRVTTDDTASYEGFVKFDIATIDMEYLSNASVITWGAQHNPSGVSEINPYWIDMYGTDSDWPSPFTWNNTRSMFMSDLLASENIQSVSGGYTFSGEQVAEWIKLKKSEGASEVAFRFHARTEQDWDIWLSGTWKGMELLLEFDRPAENLFLYTDTVGKINFTASNHDEAGWTSAYGTSSFPLVLDNGVTIFTGGGYLGAGTNGMPGSVYPANVCETHAFLSGSTSTRLTITGLDPDGYYSFCFLSSREGVASSDEQKTYFRIKNRVEPKEGEFLLIDDTYTYDGSMNGFKYWHVSDIDNMPSNWTDPLNYETGEIYTRFEVYGQATDYPSMLSFGFWQDSNDRETFASQVLLNGSGSVGVAHSSPEGWWELDELKPVDFSRPNDFNAFGVPLWSDDAQLVSTIAAGWGKKDYYHPMTVRSIAVAVADGYNFSGWDYWLAANNRVGINAIGNSDQLLTIQNIRPSSAGVATIEIWKLNEDIAYINSLVIAKGTPVSSHDIKFSEVKCYPVPAQNRLNIDNLPVNCHVRLFNMLGKEILQTRNGTSSKLSLDIERLNNGLYSIQIIDDHKNVIKNTKFIKK